MNLTPSQIAAGAQALTDHIYGPGAWEKCALEVRQINCQAFAAGVATLPDHTAELVEALEDVLQWIGGWTPNFTYDDEWPAAENRIKTAIGNARA